MGGECSVSLCPFVVGGPSAPAIVALGNAIVMLAAVALLTEAEASAYSSDENRVETPRVGGGIDVRAVVGGRFTEKENRFLLELN